MSLRIGLLGTGNIAARHADAAQRLGLALVSACGRDADRTSEFAQRFGLKAYVDFDRFIGESELELLIVALPPYAHDGQVESAARAGINLLVEKPIGLDPGRARAMVDAAQDVVAACGFMYRFGDAVERWATLAAQGSTGAAGHFAGSFHSNALHAPWWRDATKSGGQMVEQLIHIADLARATLGLPQSVYARTGTVFHPGMADYTAEDASAMILGYDDGRVGVLHASNGAIPGRWMKGWQIVAQRATGLFSDWNTAEIVRTAPEIVSETIAGTSDAFVKQLADIVAAIANKRPPRVPLQDGYDTLRIVLAAQRSASERREIAL